MLTALADVLIGVNDRRPGMDREVLRIAVEAHQQQVTGLPVREGGDALQTGLGIQRGFELTARRRAGVALDVDHTEAALARDVDRHPGAVEPDAGDPPLMAKRRAETLPRRLNKVVCGHAQPPWPTLA